MEKTNEKKVQIEPESVTMWTLKTDGSFETSRRFFAGPYYRNLKYYFFSIKTMDEVVLVNQTAGIDPNRYPYRNSVQYETEWEKAFWKKELGMGNSRVLRRWLASLCGQEHICSLAYRDGETDHYTIPRPDEWMAHVYTVDGQVILDEHAPYWVDVAWEGWGVDPNVI